MPAVPATHNYINGQGPDLVCATHPYALLGYLRLNVVYLPIDAKSLINKGILLCRLNDAACRPTTFYR